MIVYCISFWRALQAEIVFRSFVSVYEMQLKVLKDVAMKEKEGKCFPERGKYRRKA